MKAIKSPPEWTDFLSFYSEHNAGRPTRLGVFERNGDVVNDYWLENGLPLLGIDVDTNNKYPSIEITVGDLSHQVTNAVNLAFRFGVAGDEDGVDITDADGRTTVLRFDRRSGGA